MNYLSTRDADFISNDEKIYLKGIGLGNWLCLEHFMLGLPGTDSQIKKLIKDQFGNEKSAIFWETYYNKYLQEEDILYVKEKGMNHIRIPICHTLFYTDSFEHSIAIKQIDRVLQYCKKHRIWAILDLHSVPGGQNPDWHSDNQNGKDTFWYEPQKMKQIVELWKNIAEYYKDEPAVGGYDLINEPCYCSKEAETKCLYFSKNVLKPYGLSTAGTLYFIRAIPIAGIF